MVGDERDQGRRVCFFFPIPMKGKHAAWRKENPVKIFSYFFSESCDLFTSVFIFYREIKWEEKHPIFQWHFGHLRKVESAWANRKSQE